MVNAGCIVTVFTTTANGAAELPVTPNTPLNVDGVNITYFKRMTKDHSHFSPALLKKLWTDVKTFDVVHIHAWWNLVSVLSCLVAVMRGVPVVVSPRGTLSSYSFGNKNTFYKKLIHACLGKPLLKRSHVHVTSEQERERLINIITPKGLINIPNFIDLPIYENIRTQANGDKLKLLFLSRIEEKKGLDILLNALAEVKAPYTLTIAGDGDQGYVGQLKALAAENNLTGQINWIGFQGNDKFGILQQHDLLVLPSYDENFGNVVIESLSMGTAVLISKYVGLADYVKEKDLGWVCEHNTASFAKHIDEISKESGKLATIRANAPLTIRNDFDEAGLTKRYINMYNNIISHG